MTRRLDLLDRLEPGRLDGGAIAGVRGRHLGVGGDDVDVVLGERQPDRRQARPEERAVRRDRTRPARDICAATRQDRPRPGQRSIPARVVGDQEVRRPAARPPMLAQGAQLVDVTAGRVDGRAAGRRTSWSRGGPSRAPCSEAISRQAAPSLRVEALPAVTVPPSRKTGRSPASFSAEASGRGPSSASTRTVSRRGASTGTICSAAARLGGGDGALVAAQGEGVLVLAADPVALGDVLAGLAHRLGGDAARPSAG